MHQNQRTLGLASRQLGLMPPQGSQLEKAAAAAQRLAVNVRDRLRRGQATGA